MRERGGVEHWNTMVQLLLVAGAAWRVRELRAVERKPAKVDSKNERLCAAREPLTPCRRYEQ